MWSYPGRVFAIAIVALCYSAIAVPLIVRWNWRLARKEIVFTVIMNAISVLIMIAAGEVTLRMVSVPTVDGEQIQGMVLIPKDWERTRKHYQGVLSRSSEDLSYAEYDPQLGWVVGKGRQSASGLYQISQDGVRVQAAAERVERKPGKKVIALVGDSFTFGEEVAYKDTWASHLQDLLGTDFQVVNFGVPGYGIDQIYLRYSRDVQEWRPTIVIFGFISHDLIRSLTIYSFLSFPQWDSPFSKPRFLLTPSGVELINQPALRPQEIFSTGHITDLPHIAHDIGYRRSEWMHEWMHGSYLARYVQSRFPRLPDGNRVDEAILELNAEILKMFLAHANGDGAIPILAYLPISEDFWTHREGPTRGKLLLERVDAPHIDPMPCLRDVPAAERFARNGHYSALGNAAVAKCFAREIRQRVTTD